MITQAPHLEESYLTNEDDGWSSERTKNQIARAFFAGMNIATILWVFFGIAGFTQCLETRKRIEELIRERGGML